MLPVEHLCERLVGAGCFTADDGSEVARKDLNDILKTYFHLKSSSVGDCFRYQQTVVSEYERILRIYRPGNALYLNKVALLLYRGS